MSLASRVYDRFRKRLLRLIEKERALTGCGKAAVVRIARKIEMSPATIYRVINSYGATVKPSGASIYASIGLALGTSAIAARFRRASKSKFSGSELRA